MFGKWQVEKSYEESVLINEPFEYTIREKQCSKKDFETNNVELAELLKYTSKHV